MQVLVIGAGNMGSAFVKQLTRAGHEVSVTARDSAKAGALAGRRRGTQGLLWITMEPLICVHSKLWNILLHEL